MTKALELTAILAAIILVLALVGLITVYSLRPESDPGLQQTTERHATTPDERKASATLIERTKDDPVALFTFFLVVFTAVLSIVSVVQLNFLSRAERIASISADAAKAGADATKQAAEAAMLGQRAFIQVTPSWETDRDPRQPGPPLQYTFGTRMDNVGNTAARNLRNHIGYVLLPGHLPNDFSFPDDIAPLARVGLLGPKQMILGPHIPPANYVTAEDIAKIQRGELNLYFFGWVRYFDGFPGTPERITKFCYFVRATGNPNVPVVFPPYDQHNCADEGCDE